MKTGMAYKNIIFDVGGVLLEGPDTSLFSSAMHVITKTAAWGEWLKGELTQAQLNTQLEYSFDRKDIDCVFSTFLDTTRPWSRECFGAIQVLKQIGYKLYILSNFSRESYQLFIQGNPRFAVFDCMIFSYAVGCVKPESIIYTTILEQYALKAYESIFIDDVPSNVQAAQDGGITGIIYTPGTLYNAFAQLGITILSDIQVEYLDQHPKERIF